MERVKNVVAEVRFLLSACCKEENVTVLLPVQNFTGGLVAVNPRQQPGALSELACEHGEDTLLGLLLSPEDLGNPGRAIILGVRIITFFVVK